MGDDKICPNQPYGQHIVVRCPGCGSLHSTKNIGSTDGYKVFLGRSLFDLHEICKCKDPGEHHVVHDCKVDDIKWDWENKKYVPI